jgi:hypothetical protein
MSDGQRPSGATICVLKTFFSYADFEEQFRIMLAVPSHIGVEVRRSGSDWAYTMPLGHPRVPTRAFTDLLSTYESLWACPSPREARSRDAYHDYVLERAAAAAGLELSTDDQRTLARALSTLETLYKDVLCIPITQRAFVHGDAIVGNAIYTQGGVRLIDFSPRFSPSEIEVDYSKLVFSALGFDLRKERGVELLNLLGSWRLKLDPQLVAYYLTSHLIRVFSKEPPRTIDRRRFYEKVLHYVQPC